MPTDNRIFLLRAMDLAHYRHGLSRQAWFRGIDRVGEELLNNGVDTEAVANIKSDMSLLWYKYEIEYKAKIKGEN